jgi:iron complex transport system ATP-binding protein
MDGTAMLSASSLGVKFGNRTALRGIGFTLNEGQWLMVIGPNGAGKSTMINALSQGVAYSGDVSLNGMDIKRMKPRELARRVGVLAQRHNVGYGFTVEEVARMGRYAYASGWPPSSHAEDTAKVIAALDEAGLIPLRNQSVLTLSGGELQRVFLAQIWAQDPSILLLDEPSNHLDLLYQQQVFERVGHWLKKPGRAVLCVVHDLSLALAYGTEALLLHNGKAAAYGPVKDVCSPETLRKVYGMDVHGWMRRMLGQWD